MRRMRFDGRSIGRGLALLLVAVLPFACNVITGVDDYTFEGTPCKLAGDCPQGENECQVPVCENGLCGIRMLDGEDAATQVFGDCKRNVCRAGNVVNEVDSSDKPVTDTPCDEELCNGDQPENPPLDAGIGCSGSSDNSKCDGDGGCVACLTTSDCPVMGDPCRFTVCEADHNCRTHFMKTGTVMPEQIDGDCSLRVCDGMGGELLLPADDDVPSDGNDCTKDACSSGKDTHEWEPKGTPCGNNLFCNEFGQCTGCMSEADCSEHQECGEDHVCKCKPTSCDTLEATCGIYGDGCGGFLDCNNGVKDGDETGIDCGKAPPCAKCTLGVACGQPDDCQSGFCVEGVCCNQACEGGCEACTVQSKGYPEDGTCGHIAAGLDPKNHCVAADVSTCGQTGACDGTGNCQIYEDGSTCSEASCDASSGVFTPAGVCGDGSCNGGAPVSPIPCSPYTCVAEGCASSCVKDDDCEPNSYCKNTICTPKKKQGEACDSASACESGPCVDGYCCNSQCTETCRACNIAGSLGTCALLPQGFPDVSNCLGNKTCDGYGVCKKVNGEACAQNAECATGNCVDGVCCNTICDAPCRSCNVDGSKGTCGFVPDGERDGALCKEPSACLGGTCKKGPGEICAIGAQCFSGYCVDGVCCNTECKEACKACNVPGSAGTCSNVPSGQTDPALCPAPKHCNGQGVCVQ